jgi:hypothetical protein
MLPVEEVKRTKILVGVNTLTSVDQAVYSNHCQFWYRLGRHYPDFDFILFNPRRMSIDTMRNSAAKVALENDCDYLMFIDDDVLIPIDTLSRLIRCEADIAAGWTIVRGYPFKNMIFKFIPGTQNTHLTHWDGDDDIKDEEGNITQKGQKEGILICDAVGFSCVLINCNILRRVDAPYFVTGPFNTEDIYFCIKALEFVPEVRIVVDLDVKTSHCLGNEWIDPLTKPLYKEYVEKMNPEWVTRKEEPQPQQRVEKKEDNPFTYEEILKEAIFGNEPNINSAGHAATAEELLPK